MKKIKLLSSLAAITTLSSGVALTTTSCSKEEPKPEPPVDTSNYIVYKDKKEVFDKFDQTDIDALVPVYNSDEKTYSFTLKTKTYDAALLSEISIGSPDSNITSIPDNFLAGYRDDTESTVQYTEITDIPYISAFPNLKKVNLSQLKNVKTIGKDFLAVVPSLTELYLPTLVKDGETAPTIGNNFMFHCPNLKKLDLTPLNKINNISNGFFAQDGDDPDGWARTKKCVNVVGLEEVDMSSFTFATTTPGDYFLANAIYMKSVKLPNVDSPTIRENMTPQTYLVNCYSLEELDYTPWDRGTIQGGGGMCVSNAFNLSKVTLGPSMTKETFDYEIVVPDFCINTWAAPMWAKSYSQGVELVATEDQIEWFTSDYYPNSNEALCWRHWSNLEE